MDFNSAREKIDTIDKEIIELIRERFSYLNTIVEYKLKNKLPIEDREREKKILEDRVYAADKRGIRKEFIKNLFSLIMDESKEIQEGIVDKSKK